MAPLKLVSGSDAFQCTELPDSSAAPPPQLSSAPTAGGGGVGGR
ncbi:supervillin (predicted), isoform CRA_d, partial [Rattus norvegicus]